MGKFLKRLLLVAVGIISLASHPAHADVDQENLLQPAYLNFQPNSDTSWQQQVVVGRSGILTAVELFSSQAAPWLGNELRFLFSVNRGLAWQTDSPEFEVAVTTKTLVTTIDLSAAGMYFQEGDWFTMVVQRASGGGTLCCTLLGTLNMYPGELWMEQGGNIQSIQADLAFRTFISAVPEPSSWLILLAGLSAFVIGLRIRCRSELQN